jgi:transcriptional regulator with XRE-family HTH domain
MDILTNFTYNLKKHRKRAKLTQEKLAELCGTDFRYIGQIETGRRCPSLEFIGKIASALNIAPYKLFFDKNDTEDDLEALNNDKKQRIKSIVIENATKICSIIDEQ